MGAAPGSTARSMTARTARREAASKSVGRHYAGEVRSWIRGPRECGHCRRESTENEVRRFAEWRKSTSARRNREWVKAWGAGVARISDGDTSMPRKSFAHNATREERIIPGPRSG